MTLQRLIKTQWKADINCKIENTNQTYFQLLEWQMSNLKNTTGNNIGVTHTIYITVLWTSQARILNLSFFVLLLFILDGVNKIPIIIFPFWLYSIDNEWCSLVLRMYQNVWKWMTSKMDSMPYKWSWKYFFCCTCLQFEI